MQRLLISAAHKSSGKTTLSIGICSALSKRGLSVQPYKKGPDYIDPMWLSRAAGNNCYNLDFQTMENDEILAYIEHYSENKDISLIEGNKGLYDGVALDGSNSNAQVARLTQTPVILVIDTQGMTRGIAPLLLGYQAFETDILIAGVILNKVGGPRHEQKLRDVVEKFTSIPVVGAVPRLQQLEITERHLGLIPSNESKNADDVIASISEIIEKHVDLDLLIKLANQAPTLPEVQRKIERNAPATDLKIGIARDAAFGFYYPNDLDAFAANGAELIDIDTLNDKSLPEIDGLFIGGGFPESWMTELESNQSLRQEIRQQIENGLPVYAECGGLMYLSRSLKNNQAQSEMVGAISGDIQMNHRPQGRGYISLERTDDHPWPSRDNQNTPIDGHEFHYSAYVNPEDLKDSHYSYTYKMLRGTGINGEFDGICYKNLVANYAHLRDTRKHHWVNEFVAFVRHVKSENKI